MDRKHRLGTGTLGNGSFCNGNGSVGNGTRGMEDAIHFNFIIRVSGSRDARSEMKNPSSVEELFGLGD